jgi:hypothetical protein
VDVEQKPPKISHVMKQTKRALFLRHRYVFQPKACPTVNKKLRFFFSILFWMHLYGICCCFLNHFSCGTQKKKLAAKMKLGSNSAQAILFFYATLLEQLLKGNYFFERNFRNL